MPANTSDKTRDLVTTNTSKPPQGNTFVDKVIAGTAVVEQRPDQQQPTATRPRLV
jgi:hypothetical protein